MFSRDGIAWIGEDNWRLIRVHLTTTRNLVMQGVKPPKFYFARAYLRAFLNNHLN